MKTIKLMVFIIAFSTVFSSCSSDDDKDTIKPEIDLTVLDAFPTSCATVIRGTTIPFKALFKDNQALGAYSINIHHNFDHHNHDTEVDNCVFNDPKVPVNPWAATFTFSIPAGSSEFIAEQTIEIPSTIDTGDYHFMIQLTDAQGWATMKGLSIKIIE
jgi:hypothetical protein